VPPTFLTSNVAAGSPATFGSRLCQTICACFGTSFPGAGVIQARVMRAMIETRMSVQPAMIAIDLVRMIAPESADADRSP